MNTHPNLPNTTAPDPDPNPRRVRDCRPMTQIARRLRRAPTPAETALWEVLRDRRCGGLRFLRQHDIGHYVVDFYCAEARLAVEVDGAIHDIPAVLANDRERETFLREEAHIGFLRLRNEQVLRGEPGEIHHAVLAAVAERRQTYPLWFPPLSFR